MTDDLFGDLGKAKTDRDAALKQVTERGGDWQSRAIAAIPLMLPGFEGTAEDIRIRMLMKGFGPPHHYNAWGAMIMAAEKQRVLRRTGQRRHMKGSKSHARKTDVYIVRS